MKISFDFDGCLGHNPLVQALALNLITSGVEVYIITHRNEHMSKDIFELAYKIGIKKENVVFTKDDKYNSVRSFNIDMHFDDDAYEIDLINKNIEGNKGVLIAYNKYFEE